VTGSEAAEKLTALAALVRGVPECRSEDLVALLAMALGTAPLVPQAPAARAPEAPQGPRGGLSNADHCRLKRLRRKGAAATELTRSRPNSDPTTPLGRDPVVNSVATQQTTETDREATRPGPPSALPLSEEKEENHSSFSSSGARATENPTSVATQLATQYDRPRNLASALLVPICPRARLALENPHDALWLEPQKWPEIVQVAAAFAAACGGPAPRLLRFSSDAAVRHLCELYAAEFTLEELLFVADAAPRQPWWNKDGKRFGLTSLSAEVVRRTLEARTAKPRTGTPSGQPPARPVAPRAATDSEPAAELPTAWERLQAEREAAGTAPVKTKAEQLAELKALDEQEAAHGS
jgi:hypothetical protein